MTTCKECNKVVNLEELTEGLCTTCISGEEKKDEIYMDLRDYRNLYTFSGKSGGLNLFVYGAALPALLIGISLLIGNGIVILVSILLGLIVGLAAVVRRGRDAGMTPTYTIVTLFLTSFIMGSVLESTPLGVSILFGSGNLVLGYILLALIQNFYFVYLIFAKKREEIVIHKTSKFVKVLTVILVVVLLVIVGSAMLKV